MKNILFINHSSSFGGAQRSLYEYMQKIDKKKFNLFILSPKQENDLLKNFTKKKLVCTNPDLIVHRGSVEELCAGSVAKVFEDLGGEVIYFGKPHKEVYNMCIGPNEKVLAIGDNLRTDIKGANNLKIDCIFISEGVHRREFNNFFELNKLLEKYNVKANFFQKELKW